MIHEEPVCAEPKLFIGGLRFDVGREDIFNHFSQYGPIKNCVLLKHQDTGKSKGCAMVLYAKWANAEAAVNTENGTASNLSGPRQLIVKFADPQRRQEDGVLIGVTPRKLFVGQVARGVTSDQIRGIFSPYGEIADLNVMPPKKDGAMGCAFVTFATWAAAEQAIEGVDGKFTLPGASNPIAVKFADAKPQDIQRVGAKRGMDMQMGGGMMGGANKRQFMGQQGGGYGGGKGGGMGMGGMGNMGMGMMPGMMGMMPGMMPGMMGMGYGMGMGNMMGMGGMGGGMGGMGSMGYGMGGMGGQGNMGQANMGGGGQSGPMSGGMQGGGMQGGGMPDGGDGSGYGAQQNMMQGQLQDDGQQGSSGMMQQGGTGMGAGMQGAGMMQGNTGMGGMGGGMQQQGGRGGMQGAGMGGMGGQMGGMGNQMGGDMGMGNQMGMGGQGMMGGSQMGMGGMGGMGNQMGGMGGMGNQMGMGGGMGGNMGAMSTSQRGVMGIGNENGNLAQAKQWKLFIGQISFTLNEGDLFPFFSQFGTILELVLLRGNDGRNKGCGFLIYNSQEEAENAIANANGATLPNDMGRRPLMVKYANQRMQQ